jgi:hypothetical protein
MKIRSGRPKRAKTAGDNPPRTSIDYFLKKKPKDEDFTTLAAFLNGVDLTGTAQANNLLASGNIPEIINYAVTSAIVLHADSSSKNFYLSQDPTTGRWSIIPWDLDHTWGHKCCGVSSNFVTPAEPQDQTSELMRAVLAVPDWRTMYFRRLRTVVNQVLAPGQLEALYDAKVTPAAPEITLDLARWPKPGVNTTAAAQRTQLFSAIQSRRNVFAADSRVPGNQSASPAIVVNEIQPSAVNGTGGQFGELYNPSATEAVDLSGWTLSGSVAATIQPGTVILPHGTMTFVANDPSFRASYGGLVFVGGTFTGSLPGTGTVTLSRTDATVANTVSYGGVGWPDTSTGQSMELVDPTSDNSLGSSWAASVRAAGSPGAANQVAAAGTLPDAPTIGTSTAGATAATVRWTAPSNTGGTPIAGYRIRVLDGLGNSVGVDQPAAPTVTSVVVTGLTAGTAYQFQVAAINTAGVGPFSGSSNLVTPVVPSVSSVPVIGTAASGGAGGSITATARWTPPTSAGSSPPWCAATCPMPRAA